jgi:hypothetical protein
MGTTMESLVKTIQGSRQTASLTSQIRRSLRLLGRTNVRPFLRRYVPSADSSLIDTVAMRDNRPSLQTLGV